MRREKHALGYVRVQNVTIACWNGACRDMLNGSKPLIGRRLLTIVNPATQGQRGIIEEGVGMKTKFVKKCNANVQERLIVNPPYTVFGHTLINPSFSMIMKVGGLRKMIEDLGDEDSLRIEMFHGNKPTEYSFIKKEQD